MTKTISRIKKLIVRHRKMAVGFLAGIFIVAILGIIAVSQQLGFLPQNSAAKVLTNEAPVSAAPTTMPTPTPTPVPTPSPTPTPTPTPEGIKTHLTATSSEEDLYAIIRDENGEPIYDQVFTLTFTYPDGSECTFNSETDGTCYLVRLTAGEYGVTMHDKEGFVTAESITCTVNPRVERVAIDNITEVVDVVDITDISTEEVKTGNTEPVTEEKKPEIIVTTEAEQAAASEEPVMAPNGYPAYTYSYSAGPNGFLYLRGTQTESDVKPVEIDGFLSHGERQIVTEIPADPAVPESTPGQQISYEEVSLYNFDNTPVAEYEINAAPVVRINAGKSGWQEEDGITCYYYSGERVKGLKTIDGKLYYFNQNGAKAGRVGIDVSYFNESIDWNAVKNQGVDFALIRVGGRGWGSGSLYDDTMFGQNLWGAKNAGIKVGVYFYSTAITAAEAVEEASVTLERLGGVPLDFPIFIDREYSNEYPNGRSDLLSREQQTAIVKVFCDTIRNSGYSAGVYSGKYCYNNSLNVGDLLQYTIWLASYTSNSAPPAFGYNYNIWQMTDSGVVNGISGLTDINVIF